MKVKRLIVYLTVLLIVGQSLSLTQPVKAVDATVWRVYQIDVGPNDQNWDVGLGMMDGQQYLKTRQYVGTESTFWHYASVNVTSWDLIANAYFSFYAVETYNNATAYNAVLRAVDLADDMTINADLGPITDPSLRPLTEAQTMINDQHSDDWSAGWHNVTVKEQLVEVMRDHVDWVANNSITLRLDNVAGADRYVRSYEYGDHSYGAKLYIEVITDRSYAGGWDNHLLHTTVPHGDLWEVWNSSVSGGLFGNKANDDFEFFTYGDPTHQEVDSRNTVNGAGQGTTAVYNNVIYATASNASYGYLYTSSDSGQTWIAKIAISPVPAGFIRISLDNSTGVIHIAYVTSTSPKLYYNTYTIATNTLGSALEIRSTGSAECYGIKYYDSKIWVVWGDGGRVWEMKKTGSTWSGDTDISNGANFPALTTVITFIVDANDIHTAAIWNNNPLWNSRVVEPDLSLGALKTIPDAYHLGNNGARSVEGPSKAVRWITSVASDPYSKPPAINDLITSLWTWGGDWSAVVIVASDTYTALDVAYGTVWDTDAYAIAYNYLAGTPKRVQITTGTGSSWGNVASYDFSYDNPTNVRMISTAGSGTHYYQFHYYNCTWLDPTPTPIIPPDPWIPIDDPDTYPDPTGFLDRLHMRLYFIIAGLSLLLFPPISWSAGNTAIRDIGLGLVSMAFGIALLVAAGFV